MWEKRNSMIYNLGNNNLEHFYILAKFLFTTSKVVLDFLQVNSSVRSKMELLAQKTMLLLRQQMELKTINFWKKYEVLEWPSRSQSRILWMVKISSTSFICNLLLHRRKYGGLPLLVICIIHPLSHAKATLQNTSFLWSTDL